MANIPLQYPFPYKTINSTGFTSSVEFVNVTVLGDVTIDQNLTVSGNITTTDLTVGDDLTVGGQIDAQVLRAFGVWDTPIQTVNGAGAWIGFDASGHTIFANRKSTAGQTNSFRWYAFDHTNAFQGELMRLSNAGNLFVSGTKIEFPLVHFQQPSGTFPQYDFILPSSMGGAGQILTSAGAGNPTYWTTPSGGGGGGGTVTNVTGTSPISVTSPTTTPNISLGTVPTTLGGTGLTTVGTNGQVLTSNGTTLQYVTLPTPVTSVSATSPLASSGGATPTISIASSTGSGSVVLQSFPTITNNLLINSPATTSNVTLEVYQPNISDTYSNSIYLGKNSSGNEYGYISYRANATISSRRITIGYGSTQIVINGAGQIVAPGVIGSTAAWYFSTSLDVTAASAQITINNNTLTTATHTGLQVFGSALTTGQVRTMVGASSTAGNFVSFGWQHDPTLGNRYGYINTNNANVMTFATNGNIGIGTTSPAAPLDVNGNIAIKNYGICVSTANDTTLGFATTDGQFSKIESYNNAATVYRPLALQPYGGNVGIGTTSPGAKFVIEGAPAAFGIQYLASTATLSTTINTVDILHRWYESTGNASYIDLSWIRTSAGGNWLSAGQRFQAKVDSDFQAYIQFNGNNNYGLSFGTGFSSTAHGVAERMRITETGNVGIGTTNPVVTLDVLGETVVRDNQLAVKKSGTGVNANISIEAGSNGSPSLANTATLNFYTIGGGGGLVGTVIRMKYDATYGYHHEHSSDTLVSTSPIVGKENVKILSNSNPTDCQSMLSSSAGNTGLEMRAINGTVYIDMTAKTPSPGIDYDFRIAKTNTNDVNFYNAHSGSFIFDKGVRATNFSTNGLQAFTYASGTFTPRIAMFYTIDGKVYECNSAPAGRDNIAITYTVQTGVWVRMGNTMMINMEIQYNQTYSGIFFSMNDLNIVAVIPEDACKPLTLGAVGVTGYPSRIRDRFVDNFQMNYWISNTAYAPGGTICEVQLRRDNTHNMCPWDPTNKTGERVNITASYYVNQ